MLGAIAGDVIGSVYEANPIKTTDFPLFTKYSRFTDDTVLTMATAQAVLGGLDYASVYCRWNRLCILPKNLENNRDRSQEQTSQRIFGSTGRILEYVYESNWLD
jgi:ADP-ribosylglycohydrolase